jgi:hypothetical protein
MFFYNKPLRMCGTISNSENKPNLTKFKANTKPNSDTCYAARCTWDKVNKKKALLKCPFFFEIINRLSLRDPNHQLRWGNRKLILGLQF